VHRAGASTGRGRALRRVVHHQVPTCACGCACACACGCSGGRAGQGGGRVGVSQGVIEGRVVVVVRARRRAPPPAMCAFVWVCVSLGAGLAGFVGGAACLHMILTLHLPCASPPPLYSRPRSSGGKITSTTCVRSTRSARALLLRHPACHAYLLPCLAFAPRRPRRHRAIPLCFPFPFSFFPVHSICGGWPRGPTPPPPRDPRNRSTGKYASRPCCRRNPAGSGETARAVVGGGWRRSGVEGKWTCLHA